MPKTFTLIKKSIADAWRFRRTLVPIILLVMIPVVALTLITSSDQTLGTYGSFATLIMNIAVISTVIKLNTGSSKVTLSEAYYGGTTRFVATVCVVALLGLQLLFFAAGVGAYISGTEGATVGLSLVEKLLVGIIPLAGAAISFRWLTRSVFALYLVQDDDMRPVRAVRSSSSLVRGKSWPVFGRILAGAVLMMVVLIIPSLAISTLPESASWLSKIATSLLQVVSALVLVPFASVYGYNILEALGGKPKTS